MRELRSNAIISAIPTQFLHWIKYFEILLRSQVKGLPRCHGISVKLSGRLPSCLANPTGSLETIIIIIIIDIIINVKKPSVL